MTIRAGDATRPILEPELFFSDAKAIAGELYDRYQRSFQP
jgi:hypothetical protein